MLHVFDTSCESGWSLAEHIGFKDMKTTTFDTKEGKQMKLNRIPIYAKHPKTKNIQDALIRIPQQLISAAYGDQKSAKVRVAVDIVQNIDEIEKCFSDLAEATLPTLQKVAMALNRKFSSQDLEGLKVKLCGDSGACKIFVDIYRYGAGGRPASRFYRDTEDMSDVPVSQLFSSVEGEQRKRRRTDGGEAQEDSSVISITPFKAELLIHVESVLICASSVRFVLSVREGVVPSDVGIQYSLLRQGKVWGGSKTEPADALPTVSDEALEAIADPEEHTPPIVHNTFLEVPDLADS